MREFWTTDWQAVWWYRNYGKQQTRFCYNVSVTTNLISSDRYTAIKVGDLLLVTVYMPCVGTAQRDSLYNDILCELDALLYAHRTWR